MTNAREQSMKPSLERYTPEDFSRGRSKLTEALWLFVQAVFVASQIPGSWHRRVLLRIFGAQLGAGVVIKSGVRIKFPWRLRVGDHAWIGENVWIDNLAMVSLGSHACLSQGVYLCTGSHDWSSAHFDLVTRPITIADHAWVAAMAKISPGVTCGEGAVLALGSVAAQDLAPWTIYMGVPAQPVRSRQITA